MNTQTGWRLVYILGYGRSGTTLLEGLLSGMAATDCLGEMKYFYERGLLGGERCSCGSVLSACTYWSKLAVSISETLTTPGVESTVKAMNTWEATKPFALNLSRRLFHKPPSFETYIRSQEILFSHLSSSRPSTRFFVDSSKMPARLYWLVRELRLPVKVILMVRDPRAVAWSCMRQVSRPEATGKAPGTSQMPVFGYWSSLMKWGLNSYTSLAVLRLLNIRPFFLRYEDLIADPKRYLDQIADFLGATPQHESTPAAMHSVSGNPRRFSADFLTITPDTEWERQLSKARRSFGYWLNLPLNAYFRYSK